MSCHVENGQREQTTVPADNAYEPSLHRRHELGVEAPVAVEYVPAGQSSQAELLEAVE